MEQKQEIFQAVYHEAYGLMTNRFGNFLVQRIFEVGTPEQIRLLAQTMKGNVLTLTCEPFGCHVVQKVTTKTKGMSTELFLYSQYLSLFLYKGPRLCRRRDKGIYGD
jgi:hypothetical protein